MKIIYTLILIVVLILGMNDLALAQAPELPDDPDAAPIDGGLSILAVAGGAYAIRKLTKKQD